VKVYFSSMSSYTDDGCDDWFVSKNKKVALLGSFANDLDYVQYVYNGTLKSCGWFMLDSGAVSVLSGKAKVDLVSYCKFLKSIPKELPVENLVIGFDVIGDPEKSFSNFMRMKHDFGIENFIPVFHYKTPLKYLERLLKEGWDYIGLGGTASKVGRKRLSYDDFIEWWDSVFFTTNNGKQVLRYPDVKFHGFAVTSDRAINMFPWESVDSTAWVKNAAYGKVITAWGDIRISRTRSGTCRLQFGRRDPATRKKIVDWIESFGFNLNEVYDSRFAKNVLNIEYHLWLQDHHQWKPKSAMKQSVFNILGDDADAE